jgi:hypothetical protein
MKIKLNKRESDVLIAALVRCPKEKLSPKDDKIRKDIIVYILELCDTNGAWS